MAIQPLTTQEELTQCHSALSTLCQYYPDFDDWFLTKVVPGVGTGTRAVFSHRSADRVTGICICKKTNSSRKVCTLWVDPAYRGRGIGIRLLNTGMAWLNTRQPLLSIPAKRLSEFSSIIAHFNFRMTSIQTRYQSGSKAAVEFYFNENEPGSGD